MYKTLLENLLNYDADAKKIQLSTVGFSGESGNFAQTHPNAVPLNHGLKARATWFKDVNFVEFCGRLMADICNQD